MPVLFETLQQAGQRSDSFFQSVFLEKVFLVYLTVLFRE